MSETRRRIEEAAVSLFAEEGIDAISIRRIAERAGVSQGAMYNHYAAKDDLAWALFSKNYLGIGQQLRRRVRAEKTFEAKIRAVVEHIYASFDADLDLWSYVFFARHTYIERIEPSMNNPYIVVRTVIADAIKRGELPKQDIEVATSIVSGAILQVADGRVLGRVEGTLSSHTAQVASACVNALRGTKQDKRN